MADRKLFPSPMKTLGVLVIALLAVAVVNNVDFIANLVKRRVG